MSPWEMKNVINKIKEAGSGHIILTERGTSFGYNNLVVDFRSMVVMRDMGYPVIFDATHSVQFPVAAGGTKAQATGNSSRPLRARRRRSASTASSWKSIHVPDEALCDGPNMVDIAGMVEIVKKAFAVREAAEA